MIYLDTLMSIEKLVRFYRIFLPLQRKPKIPRRSKLKQQKFRESLVEDFIIQQHATDCSNRNCANTLLCMPRSIW